MPLTPSERANLKKPAPMVFSSGGINMDTFIGRLMLENAAQGWQLMDMHGYEVANDPYGEKSRRLGVCLGQTIVEAKRLLQLKDIYERAKRGTKDKQA